MLPTLQVNKLACHSFMNVCRRVKTQGEGQGCLYLSQQPPHDCTSHGTVHYANEGIFAPIMSFLFPVGFLLGQSILQEGAYNKSLSVTMLTFCPSMQGQVDFYHLFHYEKH
jgi:hypothetical protein